MLNIIFFVIQLIILFLLAGSFSKNFFKFWFLLTKSKMWAMRFCSVFLLPGTLVHELSHWLVAELLQVATGKMSLMPQFIEGEGIKMGSVMIAKTDVFRRTLIGLAPLFVGLILISLLVGFLPKDVLMCKEISCFYIPILIVVGVFLLSNTMFSSKKDMEAAFVPFAFLVIGGFAFWWFEWKLPESVLSFSSELIVKMNSIFLLAIVINIVFLLIVKLLTTLFGKVLRRRIVS